MQHRWGGKKKKTKNTIILTSTKYPNQKVWVSQCEVFVLFYCCMMTNSVDMPLWGDLFHLCQSFLYNVPSPFSTLSHSSLLYLCRKQTHTDCRSSFTDIFHLFWCIHTSSVWNVTLICTVMISREITPSWLMAMLLPQKPPWAMWYDSPVIRH